MTDASKLLRFLKKCATPALTLTTQHETLQLMGELVPEVDRFRSTGNQEALKATHSQSSSPDKTDRGELFFSINQILNAGKIHGKSHPKCPTTNYDMLWFPMAEMCPNPENLPNLQRKIYNITQLQKRDTLNPQKNSEDRETFAKQFDWSLSALIAEQLEEMHEILGE